jgi:hypothetical protein
MKLGRASLLVAAFAVSTCLAEEMPWAKDWESAKKAAAESKKLLMVDFYTDW